MNSGGDLVGLWKGRMQRVGTRAGRAAGDVERFLSWHLRGGRKFFTRYAPELLRAHKWCFIVGCNNSGTSLLHTALERSGEVSTLPFEGQRYTRVLKRAYKRGHDRVWSEYIDELRLSAADPYAEVPRLLHDWLREFRAPIRETIVEKTTANAVRMNWLQQAFPNSYFVGMVRNGYAVVEGVHRKAHKSIERGARHWHMVNSIMMKDAVGLERFLPVRYEDLVERPEDTAERLARFLGLDAGQLLAAMDQEYTFKTVRGEERQPIRNMNGVSIRRLSPDDTQTIRMLAGEMLDRFGYTADSV